MASSTSVDRPESADQSVEAPHELTTSPARTLGFVDQATLWGNFGISLFGPVTGVFVAQSTGSLGAALLATAVGCLLGALLLGTAATFGSVTGAPAMVCLRGLFGRRGSLAPTVLNLAQNTGWATLEIILIAEAASAAVGGEEWRPVYVVLAGVAATAMAVRPLGSARLLRRVMVWLVLAATAYLFFEVLRQPLGEIPDRYAVGFWPGVDLALAGVVSFAALAADYSRHSRTDRAAFAGAALGYGGAAFVYYTLGVLAVAAFAATAGNVVSVLVSLPAGALMLAILAVDEVDEAFANIYSTAMTAHNVAPRADRRLLAVLVGGLATTLALAVDLTDYESFLFLVGSVFVSLFAVAAVDFLVVSRRRWDLSATSRLRWQPTVAWAAGFVAYQLVYPGTLPYWSDFWTTVREFGVAPPGWFGASVAAIGVGATTMLVLGLLSRRGDSVTTR